MIWCGLGFCFQDVLSGDWLEKFMIFQSVSGVTADLGTFLGEVTWMVPRLHNNTSMIHETFSKNT